MLNWCKAICLFLIIGATSNKYSWSQEIEREIGFIEEFALAKDREAALSKLIPGTEEYFLFHCLHYQNSGDLARAQSILEAWLAKVDRTDAVRKMQIRQAILEYPKNPAQTLSFLEREFGLNLNHSAPVLDQAASIPTLLDPDLIDISKRLENAFHSDYAFQSFEDIALGGLLPRDMPIDRLRALLQRLSRTDLPHSIAAITTELSSRDSGGFGSLPIHGKLTLSQMNELLKNVPALSSSDSFVRQYLTRLLPSDAESISDPETKKDYVQNAIAFLAPLPATHNSLKAIFYYHRLKMQQAAGNYNREHLIEYLMLPRVTQYYIPLPVDRFPEATRVQLNLNIQNEIQLPPIIDDMPLIVDYLEHFFQADGDYKTFEAWLNSEFLQQIFAATKILYGIGDAKQWYAQLNPSQQTELRNRVELKFSSANPRVLRPEDQAQLTVDIKNVPQLIIKVYKLNTARAHRETRGKIGTDLDLDGLVPNFEQTLEYSQPADRRHREVLPLDQITGRGVWIIDLLGGGQRSRALLQKGQLIALERFTDNGHMLRIINESGAPVPSAKIELGLRSFSANPDGDIFIPYSETASEERILIVDGDFAHSRSFSHRAEKYDLSAAFLVDLQHLLAGSEAVVPIRVQLSYFNTPLDPSVLENINLTLIATDLDGVASTQTKESISLTQQGEFIHRFRVPPRLKQLSFSISAKIYNQSKNATENLLATKTFEVSGIESTNQIGDVFLTSDGQDYLLDVRGRNGEALTRTPVQVTFSQRGLSTPVAVMLATNDKGLVRLGNLPDIVSFSVQAGGFLLRNFLLDDHIQSPWPAWFSQHTSQAIHFPSIQTESHYSATRWTLVSLHSNHPVAYQNDNIKVQDGEVIIDNLPPGTYRLMDHLTNQSTTLFIADGKETAGFWAGANRVVEKSPYNPTSIASITASEKTIDIQVEHHDAFSRVHIFASPYWPDAMVSKTIHFPLYTPGIQGIPKPSNSFVDSLRLDEEHRYILQRQFAEKFPGNMLPQPSLLLNPWEIGQSASSKQDAAAGDALPASPAEADSMGSVMLDPERRAFPREQIANYPSYQFLKNGTQVFSNLRPDENGAVTLPREKLEDGVVLQVIAIHPSGVCSRVITLPHTPAETVDLRLKEAYDSQTHLAEMRRVKVLEPGSKIKIGDVNSTRIQIYGSLQDVYGLYGTLLGKPEWEQFRPLTIWNTLSDDEKRATYDRIACHEVHLFLYFKDRLFFDTVVKPYIINKLEKQFLDDWLLEEPLDKYLSLWQYDRLNATERILLASRLNSQQAKVKRWLENWVQLSAAKPPMNQKLFDFAIAGRRLDSSESQSSVGLAIVAEPSPVTADSDRYFDAIGGRLYSREESARGRSELADKPSSQAANTPTLQGIYIPSKRGNADGSLRLKQTFFRSLDQTRQWAENQYYHLPLAQQMSSRVPPNRFWLDSFRAISEGKALLSEHLELPTGNLSEALLALSVLDLPLEPAKTEIDIDNGELYVTTDRSVVAYVKQIEIADASQELANSVMIGQDIFPHNNNDSTTRQKPIQNEPLIKGIPYISSVVVTNPTNQQQEVSVLLQIPEGALPLASAKPTQTHSVSLDPYSTHRIQTAFYFPESGNFKQYGAQANQLEKHVASTEGLNLEVLDKPENLDTATWEYIADWGTENQIFDYLSTANLLKTDLRRVAFRMQDRGFFDKFLKFLSDFGMYDDALWAYSVKHNVPERLQEYLENQTDIIDDCGPHLQSVLLTINSQDRWTYQHIDFRPLVAARIHQLNDRKVILNDKLLDHYQSLMMDIAYHNQIPEEANLPLTYYMLLQNRVAEALLYFEAVDVADVKTDLQYQYFDAYLDFYRGNYDRADQIAAKYDQYPVPRWRDLFGEIRSQIRQRRSILETGSISLSEEMSSDQDLTQRLATDQREQIQAQQAALATAIDLRDQEGRMLIDYRNTEKATINYYLMDIELLFSRNPFVQQNTQRLGLIEPNFIEVVSLEGKMGTHEIVIPKPLQNRNLLVEVVSNGISRSRVVYANSLAVSLSESFGRVSVLTSDGRQVVTGAYIKVYAQTVDGQVNFYKDGYTDLRGQFDYATLSTQDLDSVSKFSILILDPEKGATVREAAPPKR